MTDFFVSYTGVDRPWAEWISWQLEAVGYRVVVQAWDFGAGSHFVHQMHAAAVTAARTIAVVSTAYLTSVYGEAEWQAAWAADPTGDSRKLVPVWVEDCLRPGLLGQLVGVDLFNLDHEAATERLLTACRGTRGKPAAEPDFPGAALPSQERPEPTFPGRLPEIWNVPARHRNFTGRAKLLAALHLSLAAGRPAAATALHGMGGVGKSQLALEYAHRHAAEYTMIWWIEAQQTLLVGEKLAALARPLGLLTGGPTSDTALAVLAALARREDWLLVFDSAQDPAGLRPWLPGGSGHVLITSQHPAWATLADPIKVDVFDRAESTELLTRCVPGADLVTTDALAAESGDLPLALAAIASYITTTGIDPARCLVKFRNRRATLLAKGNDPSYRGTVATAWSVALEQLQADHPATVQLLRLCALLAPEPIPVTLFSDRPWLLASPLADACGDSSPDQDLDDVVGAARCYSLVDRTGEMIKMHGLVQAVIADTSRQGPDGDAVCRTAIALVAGAVDDLEYDRPTDWPRYRQLTPHLAALCQQSAAHAVDSHYVDHLVQAIAGAVGAHGASGTYAAGEALASSCLDVLAGVASERALLQVRHALAWQVAQRNPAEAEQTYRDILAAREWLLGRDHPDTVASRQELAWIAAVQRRWTEAEAQYRDVLDARSRVLGGDHPETLITWHELGWAIANQGRYDEAELILRDLLDVRRVILGEDHPRTLATIHELAWIVGVTGRWSKAEVDYRRILDACRRVLGEKHPYTLTVWFELAWVLAGKGCRVAALTEYQAVLAARRDMHGDHDPGVSETRLCIEFLRRGEIPPAPCHIA